MLQQQLCDWLAWWLDGNGQSGIRLVLALPKLFSPLSILYFVEK